MKEERFITHLMKGLRDAAGELIWIFLDTSYKGFRTSDLIRPGYDRRKFSRGLYNLRARGIVKKAGGGRYTFTHKGRKWLKGQQCHEIRPPTSWDGKWRLIIFDIPTKMHRERGSLRRRLRSFGFTMLQKSVFAFPYPCEGEVGRACADLDVSDYVDVVIAESIGSREESVKNIYGL